MTEWFSLSHSTLKGRVFKLSPSINIYFVFIMCHIHFYVRNITEKISKPSVFMKLTICESLDLMDILECEVKWALGSITTNKASGGDGIPVELFQILKDGSVKVLHSICQQIWKTQQWPQDWKRSVLIPVQRRAMPKNVQTTTQLHSSHMLAK